MMSTQMSEEDWDQTLLVFRGCYRVEGAGQWTIGRFGKPCIFTVENVR